VVAAELGAPWLVRSTSMRGGPLVQERAMERQRLLRRALRTARKGTEST
jgi:hypothetical protein